MVPVYLLTLLDSSQDDDWNTFSLEEYIDGEFRKVLNNTGDVTENYTIDDSASKMLAFAHFTHQKYNAQAMACDLQGSGYLLTDPQIAHPDVDTYARGNLMNIATSRFGAVHQCNTVCTAIGLSAIRSRPSMAPAPRQGLMSSILPIGLLPSVSGHRHSVSESTPTSERAISSSRPIMVQPMEQPTQRSLLMLPTGMLPSVSGHRQAFRESTPTSERVSRHSRHSPSVIGVSAVSRPRPSRRASTSRHEPSVEPSVITISSVSRPRPSSMASARPLPRVEPSVMAEPRLSRPRPSSMASISRPSPSVMAESRPSSMASARPPPRVEPSVMAESRLSRPRPSSMASISRPSPSVMAESRPSSMASARPPPRVEPSVMAESRLSRPRPSSMASISRPSPSVMAESRPSSMASARPPPRVEPSVMAESRLSRPRPSVITVSRGSRPRPGLMPPPSSHRAMHRVVSQSRQSIPAAMGRPPDAPSHPQHQVPPRPGIPESQQFRNQHVNSNSYPDSEVIINMLALL
ncbi:uncharacterized protein [Amphiura filiformis]|uniref:uncharacterized protein isoform X2 n=1 Tax=Amphiura filiformis TaxID=82378 RepID=UPI003B20FE8D